MHTTKEEMWAELEQGKCASISEDLFEEYLDILPPVFMGRTVALCDGRVVHASYGFAEGQGVPVIAFWKERHLGAVRYFAQQTKIITGVVHHGS